MAIKAFTAERDAGLADLIEGSTKVTVAAVARPCPPNAADPILAKVRAAANPGQPDLFYLEAVLVTAGVMNKNDDFFAPGETWGAKASPEDKPFNYEHDSSDIIGHITGCRAVADDGTDLAPETGFDALPEKFHLVTSAVIYRYYEDPDRQARTDKVIAEIPSGGWYVSMEAAFQGFDYVVVEPSGTSRVVARASDTAFLTKHLRAYGGTGVWDGKRIGRVLRNVCFAGKGLVRNPANPESVILPPEKTACAADAGYATSDQLEKDSESMTPDEIKALTDKLAKAEAGVTELTAKLAVAVADVATRDERVKALEADVKAKDEVVATTAANLKTVTDELAGVKSELAKIEDEKRTAARLARVSEAYAPAQVDAAAVVKSFATLTDEQFEAAMAAVAQAKAAAAPAKAEPKEPTEADKAAAAKAALAKTEAPKEPALNASDSDDGVQRVQADVASYLGSFMKAK